MPYFIRSLHIVLQDCTTAEIDDCLQPLILEMTTTQPHPLAAVTMFGFLAILEDVNLPYSPFHEKFDICSPRLHNYPNSCLASAPLLPLVVMSSNAAAIHAMLERRIMVKGNEKGKYTKCVLIHHK